MNELQPPGASEPLEHCPSCGAQASGLRYCRSCNQPLRTDPLVGSEVDGRYRVVGVLGVGGMGVVYEARHTRLNKRFALKVIHSDLAAVPEFAARFEREALTASQLKHPNCIEVIDFGQTGGGQPYLVMELLEGQALSELMHGPWPPDEAIEVVSDTLRALEHAHAHGLVHRDVKPDNVLLVTGHDGRRLAKLVDFGIAKPTDVDPSQQITQFGMILGTPVYMAPEQASDQSVDARADLYSVGVLLWRLLTGRSVFGATDAMQELTCKLSGPAPRLSQVSSEPWVALLEEPLRLALEQQPDRRFQSASQFLEHLTVAQAELAQPNTATPPRSPSLEAAVAATAAAPKPTCGVPADAPTGPVASTPQRLLVAVGRRPKRVIGAVIAAVVVVLTILLWPTGPSRPPPNPLPASSSAGPSPTQASAATPAVEEVAQLPPSVRALLESARAQLISRKCKSALQDLATVLEVRPELARAHYYRGAALICRRKRAEGLAAYGRAIELDQRYRFDKRIQADVTDMLRRRQLADEALRFMGEVIGEPALSALLEVTGHRRQGLRHAAIQAVERLGAKDQIDWARALALDLDQTTSCKKKAEIISRLQAVGSVEALRALRRAYRRRDRVLGIFRGAHKHGCVRKQLREAIEELESDLDP